MQNATDTCVILGLCPGIALSQHTHRTVYTWQLLTFAGVFHDITQMMPQPVTACHIDYDMPHVTVCVCIALPFPALYRPSRQSLRAVHAGHTS